MNKLEREGLAELRERLIAIAQDAPLKATYSQGQTAGSVNARLLDAVRDLERLMGGDEPSAEEAGE